MLYLDNAATSFPKPQEVIDAITIALNAPASPGRSGHKPALEASRVVYRARKAIAKLFGIGNLERVAFTPNITWAINIALGGIGLKAYDHVLSSALEHNSTARPLALLAEKNIITWETVAPGPDGLLRAEDFASKLKPNTRLVVLCHGSNVTGALAPAKAIKEAIGEVPILLDLAQTAGAMPLEDLGSWADIITFTGHKGLLGPTGTGGLYLKEGIGFQPLAVGGTGSRSESLSQPDFLPDALEAGTLNTHGLAGLAAGVNYLLEKGLDKVREHELNLVSVFLEDISKISKLSILGPGPGILQRVSTVSLNIEGWSSSDLAGALEAEYGIMTRSGLHCSPLAHKAMGTFPGGAVRFSFGLFNTLEEARLAAKALEELSKRKTARKKS
ncbi:MAG: aminotransferase class V-fold PLP-dependent enzyme [Deltaproteobacteria bacterium]|nr:aminotransferase class V-fold PLP-dependent enzyme [Deltaproteobacteria bacterium]